MVPKVSILIPAYNEESIIMDTLNHVVNDIKYKNKEIIVGVDDGKDRTLKYVKKFLKNHPNAFKIYYSPQRLGVTGMMNKLINMSTGDIIFKNDADVRSNNPENCIYNLIKIFDNQDVGAIVCPMGDFHLNPDNNISLISRGEILINEIAFHASKDYFPVSLKTKIQVSIHCWLKKAFESHINPETIIHDDASIAQMILKKGYKIDIADDTWFFIGTPTTLPDLFKQKIKSHVGWYQFSQVYDSKGSYFSYLCFTYFLKNIRNYTIRDIISLVIWFLIYQLSKIASIFKSEKKPTEIWSRWGRKTVKGK